jgi:hypothetical protein
VERFAQMVNHTILTHHAGFSPFSPESHHP